MSRKTRRKKRVPSIKEGLQALDGRHSIGRLWAGLGVREMDSLLRSQAWRVCSETLTSREAALQDCCFQDCWVYGSHCIFLFLCWTLHAWGYVCISATNPTENSLECLHTEREDTKFQGIFNRSHWMLLFTHKGTSLSNANIIMTQYMWFYILSVGSQQLYIIYYINIIIYKYIFISIIYLYIILEIEIKQHEKTNTFCIDMNVTKLEQMHRIIQKKIMMYYWGFAMYFFSPDLREDITHVFRALNYI